MRIRMLGSGSGDGWPNPWCTCASCTAALAQGVVRGSTSALLDDRVLLDLGPDAARAALRQGVSLADVTLALITHRHPDHHYPPAWVWRSWGSGAAALTVAGPPRVLEETALDASITACVMQPGALLSHEGYDVRALKAEHPDGAVLYDVTSPDGARLLYATDTGVLPPDTVEACRGRAFDVVLLELAGTPIPSHLTLETWPAQVDRLRDVGAVVPTTRVVAVHLGHGNPPPDELDRRLAAVGATAARDGDVIDTTTRGHRVLVLGGQSSGKSAFAEGLLGPLATYVATAPRRPGDGDWALRVHKHVVRRPSTWRTLETADLVAVLREATSPLLIDDLGLWLTQVLESHWESPSARDVFEAALAELLDAWRAVEVLAVLVAPEVGSGVIPTTSSGRLFADLLGRASTALAGASDEVIQVVAGQPRRLR